MTVNISKLKIFAPAMRQKLIETIGNKLDLILNKKAPDFLSRYSKQIEELRIENGNNREQLLEKAAYTWFNRFSAIRYLDAKGWHLFGSCVLMPKDKKETQPELLKLMLSGNIPLEIKKHTNLERLYLILDGEISTSIPNVDSQTEVYRELVLAVCRFYNTLLPDLFKKIEDSTELLLPDDLLTEVSIAGGFRNDISDDDCNNIEIIGWLYQFYNSERKDKIIGKVVKTEDIPAATQLFTPNWVVKYMVQNSIGSTWLNLYPKSPLREKMDLYIHQQRGDENVNNNQINLKTKFPSPEGITIIDPACGSGHILIESYNILREIYIEQGYQRSEIPELILTKNIFGLDICPRAAQLSIFALLMKGREDDRKLFVRGLKLNVQAIIDSKRFDPDQITQEINLAQYGLSLEDLMELKKVFHNASTLGSLIQLPKNLKNKLQDIKQLSEAKGETLFSFEMLKQLGLLVKQAHILSNEYDAVIANPPYMGSRYYNSELKKYVTNSFEYGKNDLYSAFTLRNILLAKEGGHIGMITIPNWMFLSSFEKFRNYIITNAPIKTLVHNGRGVWGSDFGSCSYVLERGSQEKMIGIYLRLFDIPGSVVSNIELERRFHINPRFRISNNELKRLPECRIAYWITENVRKAFETYPKVDSISTPSNGVQTGDNIEFLRFWTEIDSRKIKKRWVPYNKGGKFRKWYGNIEYVVFWDKDGTEIKSRKNSCCNGEEFFRSEGITWSDVTSGKLACRYMPKDCIFDHAGPSAFFNSKIELLTILSLLNIPEVNQWSKFLNPTVHFQIGDFKKLIVAPELICQEIASSVESLIKISKLDWDLYERSLDFITHPFFLHSSYTNKKIQFIYDNWIKKNKEKLEETKYLEEKNYKVFLKAYGLSKDISPKIPIDQISLNCNPFYRYGSKISEKEGDKRLKNDTVRELLSFYVGCMMGRYSLDKNGLILSNLLNKQEDHLDTFFQNIGKPQNAIKFKPDSDAIIPVLDKDWFIDDIVSLTRKLISITFDENYLTENLLFVESAIGKDLRKYFCNEFYKDHLKTYKKRPIYLMVQSPNKTFSCLIYLHRYTQDTFLQILNNYFRPYLQKLESRLVQLEKYQVKVSNTMEERIDSKKEIEIISKQLKECKKWEENSLLPIAQQRIKINLDDGVKENYLKFDTVLAEIPGFKKES